GFVIGGMDQVRYKEYTLQLEKGSTLFVYTDGVPEATDGDGQMFGTDRMLESLNEADTDDPKQLLEKERAAVDRFVGDAEQFDDLTMLAVTLK
ncbi:MAG: serine/threonine-protein phosphatase, partial [Oscillospiraceae bacterium]|nr:serine/threonine-protein phosphatase [Oscillospiraceae bacterium]